MSLDIWVIIQSAFVNTISGLITNIFYILLAIWGIRKISNEIKDMSKNMPSWIERYFTLRQHQLKIEQARGVR